MGPHGGAAVRGPYGGAAAVGPHGGAAVRTPHGGGAAVGPHGGAAVRGPYGGGAVRGPYGGVGVRPGGYAWGGHHYYRPAWGASAIGVYARPFAAYPRWRYFGAYGLAPALIGISSLAFLSAGLLIGSYNDEAQTVYVYVVEEDGVHKEYRVTEDGQVLSERIVD